MNLTESYNELYTVTKTYNELIAEHKQDEKTFIDLEGFLKLNGNEIKKYHLESDISKMFQDYVFSLDQIQDLIQTKREEEECRRREREEEEQRRREQQERERLRKNMTIKWTIIIVTLVVLTIVGNIISVIVWILFGVLLYQKPNLREKIRDKINADWKVIKDR